MAKVRDYCRMFICKIILRIIGWLKPGPNVEFLFGRYYNWLIKATNYYRILIQRILRITIWLKLGVIADPYSEDIKNNWLAKSRDYCRSLFRGY